MTDQQRDILRRLYAAGVTLTVSGDCLQYRAPVGVLTPDLRAALEVMKVDLVYAFNERAAIMEFDGRMPRAEAEARAAVILTGGASG